jgi:hypothetical protein
MLGLGEGEGVKPNPNIVGIVMHIGILARSLTAPIVQKVKNLVYLKET